MSTELEQQMIATFKQLIEAALITYDQETVLSLVAEDVIGIGMGSQGIVSSKEDLARILSDKKEEAEGASTQLEFAHFQVRCYEGRFGTVCGVLKITLSAGGKSVVSALGQLMNLRLQDGRWLVCTMQATPLFEQIEELEAYPIKFAETVLETYRRQEQLAKNAQSDSVAVYLIDFTKGIFESSLVSSDLVINTQKGEAYETAMFEAARDRLCEEERFRFIRTFSMGNVLSTYQGGGTELSMEYEMHPPGSAPLWLRSVIKLYTDKTDQHLKGYLYVSDIDEAKRRELALQSKAELDPMTGLFNKGSAELKIAQGLQALAPGEQAAFFMIDLDRFKQINDTYGHQEGDRVICETAELLKSLSRKTDIAGRVGGDEFCLYLQGELTLAAVTEKAEQLCRGVRTLIPRERGGTSCSIGIVLCTGPGVCFQTVYQRGDETLYLQKKRGRNGYTVCTDPL